MKTIKVWAAAWILSLGAYAQIGINQDELLDCKVTSVDGIMNSFIPPKVGDTITLDLKQDKIVLKFKSSTRIGGTMISGLFERQTTSDPWKSHLAFFDDSRARQDSIESQLIIGAYGNGNDPLEQRTWIADVQILDHEKFAHWQLQKLRMECDLVKR